MQQSIKLSSSKAAAVLGLVPLVFLALGATTAAAIIAFVNGHIILGILCLPTIKLNKKEANKLLAHIIRLAIIGLTVLYSEWLVLILAVGVPFMIILYSRIVVNLILDEVKSK